MELTLYEILKKMNRLLFLILFSVVFSPIYSQRTFYSRAGDYTWIHQTSLFGDISYDANTISKDSFIIKGQFYRKFSYFYIRESGLKLYVLEDSTQDEYLSMDFGMQVGDTLTVNYKSQIEKLVLRELVKIKIGDDSLILQKFDVITGFAVTKIDFIQSIGSIRTYPLHWMNHFDVYDLGASLECVLHNDISIFGSKCLDMSLLSLDKKWYIWESKNNGDTKSSTVLNLRLDRDTVINQKTYHSMNSQDIYIRYDTSDFKYYILVDYNKEDMLYNSRAMIGDTLSKHRWGGQGIVRDIQYKFIGDIYRKVYFTDYDTFISGIGYIKNVMWYSKSHAFPEQDEGNVCYMTNARSYTYHFPDYYQLQSCDDFSSINNHDHTKIECYPYADNLIIKSTIPFRNSILKIYDLTGRLHYQEQIPNFTQKEIDISLFKNSLYLVEIENENFVIKSKFNH